MPGLIAKRFVDPFYGKHNSPHSARESDLFFVGMIGSDVVGTVRFCVENETPMLRSMLTHKAQRGIGIGNHLLVAFDHYLKENSIENTYCLPFAHLDKFYGTIGFQTVQDPVAPKFLQDRLGQYRKSSQKFICMKRP